MAGEWIKCTVGLEKKREVAAMALALKPTGTFGFDCDVIASRWLRVWSWAGRETTDGHVPSVTREVIDDVAGLPGFCVAAETVGWITVKTGGITFNNWDRHNGNAAKSRVLAAMRQQDRRERDHSVTEMSRCERDESVTRAEQQRAEKRKQKQKQQAGPISIEIVPDPPPPLDAAAFAARGNVCSLLLAVTFLGSPVFDPKAAAAIAAGPRATRSQVAWALERFAEERATEAGRARLRNPAGYIRGLIERHEPPAGWVEKFNRAEIRRQAAAMGAA